MKNEAEGVVEGGRVENARPESYSAFLTEPSRPPSRGGNTGAWHSHVLLIDGQKYSFFALGTRKWVFVGDRVSFDWKWDETGKYRNILPGSMEVRDTAGKPIIRGLRGTKVRRTASARMPVSRREMRD